MKNNCYLTDEDKALKRDVLAIVGSTYDITGIALCKNALFYDSNPSKIYEGCGGAGRNIAENMARMGLDAGIISSFGTDFYSRELLLSCESAGLDISNSFIIEGASSGKYISLLDQDGELLLAAADLSLHEAIDPNRIDQLSDYINNFRFVFVDTNNTERMLQHIADVFQGMMFADTVSENKAVRLKSILPKIDTIKTNQGELHRLSGKKCDTINDIKEAASSLIDEGVNRVFVTMGKNGSCCCTRNSFLLMPSFPVKIRNVTGAGDAFAAAIAYGTIHGFSDIDILLLGTAASIIALQSSFAVNCDMSEEVLMQEKKKLEELYVENKK